MSETLPVSPLLADSFSPEHAARYVQRSESWLKELRIGKRTKCNGPPFIRLGRRIRYLRSDLDAWILAGRTEVSPHRHGESG